mgnify:CR=1 FL=1
MTLTPTTRASLLLRLRDPRDHDAWVEFVSLYEPVIYRVLRRTGLQDADALEVLQELFLAVNRNIGRWEHGAWGRIWFLSGMVTPSDPELGRFLGSAATSTSDDFVA